MFRRNPDDDPTEASILEMLSERARRRGQRADRPSEEVAHLVQAQRAEEARAEEEAQLRLALGDDAQASALAEVLAPALGGDEAAASELYRKLHIALSVDPLSKPQRQLYTRARRYLEQRFGLNVLGAAGTSRSRRGGDATPEQIRAARRKYLTFTKPSEGSFLTVVLDPRTREPIASYGGPVARALREGVHRHLQSLAQYVRQASDSESRRRAQMAEAELMALETELAEIRKRVSAARLALSRQLSRPIT